MGVGVMDGCGTELSPTRCLRVRTEGDFFFWGSSGLGSLSLSPEEAERPWLPFALPPTPPPPAPLMAAARLGCGCSWGEGSLLEKASGGGPLDTPCSEGARCICG